MLRNNRKFKIAATAAAVAASLGILTGFTDVTSPFGKVDSAWKYLTSGGAAASDSAALNTIYSNGSGTNPATNATITVPAGQPMHLGFDLFPKATTTDRDRLTTAGKTDIAALVTLLLGAGQTSVIPSTLYTQINATLPERKDIRTNAIFPSTDEQSNIIMKTGQTSKVWATFITEGAGFHNSVGYFIYDPLNPPTKPSEVSSSEIIFFPDASQDSPLPRASGGSGPTVYLGEIPAGKAMGFFVVANGWVAGNGRHQPFTNLSSAGTVSGVKDAIDPSWVYYTLGNLNPEPKASPANLHRHGLIMKEGTVGSGETGYQRLVLAMEDYLRTSSSCDHDFNDIVLALHIEKKESVANLTTAGGLQTMLAPGANPDTDGDGVPDVLDEFPNDATLAKSRFFPGSDSWGTLGYEDLWPAKGDYDFNDLVVKYRSQEILHANGKVKKLKLTYRLDARGATFHSGFAVRLEGINADKVASIVVTKPDNSTKTISPTLSSANGSFALDETAPAVHPKGLAATYVTTPTDGSKLDASGIVIRLTDDAFDWLPENTAGTGDCRTFYNTGNGCDLLPTKTFTVEVTFTDPITTTFPSPPYDPFIFRAGDSQREVHLAGKKPTEWAKRSTIYGTIDDSTNTSTYSRTFVTGTGNSTPNLPWAIHLPYDWAYPREGINTVVAYPDLLKWGSSNGGTDTDWYTRPSNGGSYTFLNGRKFP
jgi:LruC domain-containing protein